MDPSVLNGLFVLAGVFAAGILTLIGFWIKARADLEKEFRAKYFERRLEVYGNTYDFVWSFYQSGAPRPGEEITQQVREINKGLTLVGSSAVLRAFRRISETGTEKLRAEGKNDEQIALVQANAAKSIILAIRKDLYPYQEGLRPEDIRFIEPKKAVTP